MRSIRKLPKQRQNPKRRLSQRESFANAQAAKKWDTDYRKAGGSSFVWNSENGTVIKKLGAK